MQLQAAQPLLAEAEQMQPVARASKTAAAWWRTLAAPPTVACGIITLHLLFGTLLWKHLLYRHSVPLGDAFYFAVVTFTTIGYGDVTPATTSGKVFFMIYVVGTLVVQLTVLTTFVNAAVRMAVKDEGEAEDAAPGGPQSDHHAVRMNPLLRARPHMVRALWGSGALFALVAAGAMMLHFTEGIDWLDCVYWSLTTLSTVGFGDIVPEDHKALFAAFFLVSVCLFAFVLGEVVGACVQVLKCRRLAHFFKDGLTYEILEKLDGIDVDGEVDKVEFLAFMLSELDLCDSSDVRHILRMFETLDSNGDGALNLQDVTRKLSGDISAC